jgi:hypothetical protein
MVSSPIAVELCVKGFLYEYRYRNNKEYYKLPLEYILKAIQHCNSITCGEDKLLKRPTFKKTNIHDNDDIYGLIAITKDDEKDNKKYEKKKQKGGYMMKINNYEKEYNKNKYIQLLQKTNI